LLLNGKVIGEQKMAEGSITAVFNLPYQPGILKAVNVENGKETNAVTLKTSGAPKHIRLIADRINIHADRNDLSYVSVEIKDENGQVVPYATLPAQFSISGAGEIAGVGNGSASETAGFKQPAVNTMNGKCLAIVRPTGTSGAITLKAAVQGLATAQVTIVTH
jgi:beta-galactosidase